MTHSTPPAGLSEQPGLGLTIGLYSLTGMMPLMMLDQRPQEPPTKNRDADEYHA